MEVDERFVGKDLTINDVGPFTTRNKAVGLNLIYQNEPIVYEENKINIER